MRRDTQDLPDPSIDTLDPVSEADAWDRWVAGHPHATVFHTSAWARLLKETYRLKPLYLVQRCGGEIQGALPLFETGGIWPRRRGVSVPFADTCRPLISHLATEPAPAESAATSRPLDDLATREPLLAAALKLGRERGWKAIELRDIPTWSAATGSSVEFYGHTIDLSGGEAGVMSRLSSAAARSTRKAERQELKVHSQTDLGAVRAYYELHCLTRKRHGQPPQPWSFFAALQRHLLSTGGGTVVLVLKDERPIAGAVFLFHGVGALYKFGASDENYQSLRPNNRVFWEAIKLCMQRGCNSLDLGRTSLANEGLRRFKLGWGSTERRIAYLRYDLLARRRIPTPDATEGWHTRVFQALPIPVAKLLGRIAYRFAA